MAELTLDEIRKMAAQAVEALEDKKAEDIRILDIREVSVVADYFIIASGNNRNQIQAFADEIEQRLGRAGYYPKSLEGYENANWILLDFGDLVIHLFDKENRFFYDLERIWRDGRQIAAAELK